MNSAIFWRLVWKEYRQQRALWTAIALAGLIFQVAVLAYCALNGVVELPDKVFTVALSVPILYSLGCGATLFAGEHEADTFPFQQALPVAAGRVFTAKVVFALCSALALFPVFWLLAFAMTSWKLPDATWHLQLWGGGVVATIEVLVWAVLSSLVLRRALPAAIVGGVTAALLGLGSLALMSSPNFQRHANEYFSTLPLRTCLALIALAIAVKFGRQWFNERPIRWASPATRRARSNAATQRRATPATWLTVYVRLMWHEWRQGRATILSCVFGYIVLGTWMAVSQLGTQAYLGLLPVLATICGANVFAADQRQGQYQFFTEHGVRPRLVWLSRQVVWGLALALAALFALGVQMPMSEREYRDSLAAGGFSVMMFAASQLCSINIRSGIVAVFTAAMCSILLYLWTVVTGSVGVPWILSALPLPFIFFWDSWLYAPKWIQQRQTRRVRIVTAVTIIVPLLCVVAAIAAYRVYEIPAVELSFDPTIPSSDDSPAARETATMYENADRLLRQRLAVGDADATTIASRDGEWQKGIDLFLAASRQKTCRFYHWDDDRGTAFDGKQLTRAVLAEAKARAEEGDLEGAAELHLGLLRLTSHFYQQHSGMVYRAHGMAVEQELYSAVPAWADHESLTPVRLHEALTQLQTWSRSNAPNCENSIIENRIIPKQLIALDDRILKNYGVETSQRVAIKTLGALFFWERWRMSRLLDVYTEAELQGVREILARGPRIPPQAQRILPWDVRLTVSGDKSKLVRSTDVEAWLLTTRMMPGFTASEVASSIQQYEVQRSAVQQQLALIAWRKQHGSLPDSLSELLGETFETLPLDPYTKEPFVYFPNGVEEEVWDDDRMGMGGMGMMSPMSAEGMGLIKPQLVRSEPFLWSPGEQLRYIPDTSRSAVGSPLVSDFRDHQGRTLTEQDLLDQGVRYSIPTFQRQPSDSSDNADASPNDE